jgi:hypothetical protein
MQRMAFLTKRYKSKLGESHKQLCARASNQVRFEEFKRNDPDNKTGLTQWTKRHGKFKIPKFLCNPRCKLKKDVNTCSMDTQGRPCGIGSFYHSPIIFTLGEKKVLPKNVVRVNLICWIALVPQSITGVSLNMRSFLIM